MAGLTQLNKVYLSNNQLTDLSPLAKLAMLEQLYLSNNQITDLTPLAGLTKLTHLDLVNNHNLTKAETDKLRKGVCPSAKSSITQRNRSHLPASVLEQERR